MVTKDAVKDGGYQVVVGGDACRSGSSREVAVVAHQGAGVGWWSPARSSGSSGRTLFTQASRSTDFSVIDRLRPARRSICAALATQLPDFFRSVAENGGLLTATAAASLAGEVHPTYATEVAARPLTCVEKIVARRTWTGAGRSSGIAAVAPAIRSSRPASGDARKSPPGW
ncbi:MAG: hypothetical protein R3B09_32825 [Nannocystaceae bacterium]